MANPIARRYAKAYFALAQEAGAIGAWREDLQHAVTALMADDVTEALSNPAVRRRSGEAIDQFLAGVSLPARNTVRLLIERGRQGLLGDVLTEYDRLADADSGVVRAEVITATPVGEATESVIQRTLRASLGADVQVSIRQDRSIIGGLVIHIGDRVIDNSVRTHLQQLQASLA